MSEHDQIQFEGVRYGGLVKIKPSATGMGDEKKLPKGATVAFVGQGNVVAVSFKEAGGINVREHTTAVEDVQIVPEDVVTDIIEELREAETGQPRLLSVDGESHRAARAARRERVAQIIKGHLPADDDAQEVDYFARAECVERAVADLDRDPDVFESVEDYYAELEHQYVVLAAMALAGVESMHRRRCQAVEDAREAAETAAREAARDQAHAAAVSSDDVADSEAAQANIDPAFDPDAYEADLVDDGAVPVAVAAEAVVEALAPDGLPDEPEFDVDPDGAPERMASTEQRVALSKQIMAMSGDTRLAAEWVEWCEGHGIPQHPSEMTFEQARKALVFVGDAENAEAGG